MKKTLGAIVAGATLMTGMANEYKPQTAGELYTEIRTQDKERKEPLARIQGEVLTDMMLELNALKKQSSPIKEQEGSVSYSGNVTFNQKCKEVNGAFNEFLKDYKPTSEKQALSVTGEYGPLRRLLELRKSCFYTGNKR
tara:strand:- start:310 stop:726 length:417 start_codon:yes stop_codon:yes gene_type:complete